MVKVALTISILLLAAGIWAMLKLQSSMKFVAEKVSKITNTQIEHT